MYICETERFYQPEHDRAVRLPNCSASKFLRSICCTDLRVCAVIGMFSARGAGDSNQFHHAIISARHYYYYYYYKGLRTRRKTTRENSVRCIEKRRERWDAMRYTQKQSRRAALALPQRENEKNASGRTPVHTQNEYHPLESDLPFVYWLARNRMQWYIPIKCQNFLVSHWRNR